MKPELERLLAVAEAAQEFCEAHLSRTPAPLLGDGRTQPDNVMFMGSARDLALPLLDALAALSADREAER